MLFIAVINSNAKSLFENNSLMMPNIFVKTETHFLNPFATLKMSVLSLLINLMNLY